VHKVTKGALGGAILGAVYSSVVVPVIWWGFKWVVGAPLPGSLGKLFLIVPIAALLGMVAGILVNVSTQTVHLVIACIIWLGAIVGGAVELGLTGAVGGLLVGALAAWVYSIVMSCWPEK